MYDGTGTRTVPASIAEVPFGRTVRVTFSLEYCYKYSQLSQPRVMFALLNSMSVM